MAAATTKRQKTKAEQDAEWEAELDEMSKKMIKSMNEDAETAASAPKIHGKMGIIDDVTPERGDDHLKD
jgi:transposase